MSKKEPTFTIVVDDGIVNEYLHWCFIINNSMVYHGYFSLDDDMKTWAMRNIKYTTIPITKKKEEIEWFKYSSPIKMKPQNIFTKCLDCLANDMPDMKELIQMGIQVNASVADLKKVIRSFPYDATPGNKVVVEKKQS
jgi:hypothetical protein